VYKRPALKQVVCQIRFPPILRVDAEPPAAFQDRIRATFPLYEEQAGSPLKRLKALPPEIAQILQGRLGAPSHTFASADRAWTVLLTKDALSLTATSYTRWESFREKWSGTLAALVEGYQPAFCTRIGLRYQNLIQRDDVGLKDVAWAELLRRELAGLLTVRELLPFGASLTGAAAFRLTQFAAIVHMRYGVQVLDRTAPAPDDRARFAIDNDFFTEQQTECADVESRLDYFNAEARKIFRWCISERLHAAMEPEPL
jgi:uncharacterized protein (TIGR04255 family)